MQIRTPSKCLFKAAILGVTLVLFLSSRSTVKAQALYANLGPASFSRNWGNTREE